MYVNKMLNASNFANDYVVSILLAVEQFGKQKGKNKNQEKKKYVKFFLKKDKIKSSQS